MTRKTRLSRRRFAAGVLASAVSVRAAWTGALAQEDEAEATGFGEVPSFGGMRPGPIRPAAEAREAAAAPRGVTPITIQIDKAAVDAPIERVQIDENGVMENPTGPWVVSWYEDLAAPGEGSNAVMSGHVGYWTTGPAVFWNLSQLVPGDDIRVYGEDDTVFEYAVEWLRNYVVAEMEPEDLNEIVRDTGEEALTLITCAIGTWDEATQEYRERMVLRATAVS